VEGKRAVEFDKNILPTPLRALRMFSVILRALLLDSGKVREE